MKSSLFTALALTGIFATTLANPVPVELGSSLALRQLDDEGAQLDDLMTTVEGLTGKISRARSNHS